MNKSFIQHISMSISLYLANMPLRNLKIVTLVNLMYYHLRTSTNKLPSTKSKKTIIYIVTNDLIYNIDMILINIICQFLFSLHVYV